MRLLRYGSGRATVAKIAGSGLFEVAYEGAFCPKANEALRHECLIAGAGANAFVVRFDSGQFPAADGLVVGRDSYKASAAPGALIVRPDQFNDFSVYARRAADMGVMRSVWLSSHAAMAYEWAIRQALAAQQELRQ